MFCKINLILKPSFVKRNFSQCNFFYGTPAGNDFFEFTLVLEWIRRCSIWIVHIFLAYILCIGKAL